MSTRADDPRGEWPFGRKPNFAPPPPAKWRPIVGLAVLAAVLMAVVVFCRPAALTHDDGMAPDPAPTVDREHLQEIRAARRERLTKERPELMDSPSGSDFAETPGYRKLLGRFLDHAPAAPSSPGPYFDYALSLDAPELLQGERVRVRGVLCDWWAVRLSEPVWGRQDVYRGFVAAADGTDWIAFDVLDRPENVLRAHDPVELDAVFYRTVTYEVARPVGGEDTKTVPYVLARHLTHLEAPALPTGFVKRDAWVVLTVLGLGIFWVIWRGARVARQQRSAAEPGKRPGFHAMFQRRLRPVRGASAKHHSEPS